MEVCLLTLWLQRNMVGLGQIFVNNFLNNRQLLEEVEQWAFQLLKEVVCIQNKIENFVSCDMSL